MGRFADFVLLEAVPSYGGAEILLARRLREDGLEAPVHVAMFGADARLGQRVAAAARAATALRHPMVARVLEVARLDGTYFAVGDAAAGVALSTLLTAEASRPAPRASREALATAVLLPLAQVALELHEGGDIWADDGVPTAFTAVFPAGFVPEVVALDVHGELRLRALAAAMTSSVLPAVYPPRAPETSAVAAASAASDVWSLGCLLVTLLTGDARARLPPRASSSPSPLLRLAARMLERNVDDRLALPDVVERLEQAAVELAVPFADVIRAAVAGAGLSREAGHATLREPSASVVAALQGDLPRVRARIEHLHPPAASAPAFDVDGPVGDEVFTQARHAVAGEPHRPATAATMLIDVDDAPDATAAPPAHVDDGPRRQVTSPTVLIDPEAIRARDGGRARTRPTVMIPAMPDGVPPLALPPALDARAASRDVPVHTLRATAPTAVRDVGPPHSDTRMHAVRPTEEPTVAASTNWGPTASPPPMMSEADGAIPIEASFDEDTPVGNVRDIVLRGGRGREVTAVRPAVATLASNDVDSIHTDDVIAELSDKATASAHPSTLRSSPQASAFLDDLVVALDASEDDDDIDGGGRRVSTSQDTAELTASQLAAMRRRGRVATRVSEPPADGADDERTREGEPPEPAGQSTIVIDAPSDARVVVNGAEVGRGPLEVDVVAGARIVVRVERTGYQTWSRVVSAGGRPRVRVRPRLEPRQR